MKGTIHIHFPLQIKSRSEIKPNIAAVMIETTNSTILTNITGMAPPSGPSPLKLVFDVVIKVTLVTIMFGMGSATEIEPLWKHIKRPIGILIGMMSQFVVLPLVTFGLAHALMLPNAAALGMLVVGCCPSGSTSNVFTYWVGGDVPLR